MRFYDYCLRADGNAQPIVRMAERLGLHGLCFLAAGETPKPGKLDVFTGTEAECGKVPEVGKFARKNRKRFLLLVVRSKDEAVTRKALETPEIDIVIPEHAGFDHIMSRLGKKNGVAVGFEFRQLLDTHRTAASRLFSNWRKTARLLKKHDAPFVLTSGAMSEFDLRSPSELMAFGVSLGLDRKEVSKALSDRMVAENRKRLSGKIVMPGVEIE